MGAHVGFWGFGGGDYAPADLRRKSVLVQPHLRQPQWLLGDGAKLSHHDSGFSAYDRYSDAGEGEWELVRVKGSRIVVEIGGGGEANAFPPADSFVPLTSFVRGLSFFSRV